MARKIANRADLARNHFIFRATMTHRWQTREPYPMIGGARRKTRRWCAPGFDLKFPISQTEAWLENRPLAACNVATRNTRTLRSFGERTNEPTKMTTTTTTGMGGEWLTRCGESAVARFRQAFFSMIFKRRGGRCWCWRWCRCCCYFVVPYTRKRTRGTVQDLRVGTRIGLSSHLAGFVDGRCCCAGNTSRGWSTGAERR